MWAREDTHLSALFLLIFLSSLPLINKVHAKGAGYKHKHILPTQVFLVHSLPLTPVHLPDVTSTKYVQF